MVQLRMRFYLPLVIVTWTIVAFSAGQDIKQVSVKERKLLATFAIGPQEHLLGFLYHRIGIIQVPIGPRLRFVTPDRRFLWVSDLAKKRLVLMSIKGQILKSIPAVNGELPWDLYGAMDSDGNFYFWDKAMDVITKITTLGSIEKIKLNWDYVSMLLGQPVKRNQYEFRPKCWIDEQGNIYIWIVTFVKFKGDNVVDETGVLILFDQKGQAQRVLLSGDVKDLGFFIDRTGQIYRTKVYLNELAVTIHDNAGRFIDSFKLKLPKPGHPHIGIRGRYILLCYNDSTFFYDTAMKQFVAWSLKEWRLLGFLYPFEDGIWRNWIVDYNIENLLYLWSVNQEKATLEAIAITF